MTEPLLAPNFLFRFSTPCRRCDPVWSPQGVELNERYVLPSFGELEGRPVFADLRAAWSDQGLSFTLRVAGKKQVAWCRAGRIDDSDGLQVWIDARDTHNIHRASRFCHRFAFLPFGGGRRDEEPVGQLLMINRARENPKPLAEQILQVRSEKRIDGYLLQAHIPAAAITGFDPAEQPRVGFSYAVIDRELGWQTFSVSPEFPFMEDPSLWGTLELAEK
ncbi:MAG: hypothetical protein NTY19_19300 [Planctomycetota bacterium]|nr:hypothetical protein [Planctomycetota bacterium]